MSNDEMDALPHTSPQEDLYAATEAIRAAEFSSVPADLLAAILEAEERNFDSRVTAAREVGRAVDAWLAAQPDTDAASDDEESAS